MIPPLVDKASELLDLDEDKVLSILRHFNWNYVKLEDQWFTMGDDKMYTIGLEYDPKLV